MPLVRQKQNSICQKLAPLILTAVGGLIHFGTAFLRLNTFFPYPKLKDFAAFYAGAWAIRLRLSPYEWPPSLLETLRLKTGLSIDPPAHHSPPIWACLMQPLTLLRFSHASLVWLLVLLVLTFGNALMLARVAGYKRWGEKSILFLFVLTFGPVFLDLTLGQNGLFLLAAALVAGWALQTQAKSSHLLAGLAWILAVGAKLFPIVWLCALPLLRRWRLFVLSLMLILLAMGLAFLLTPTASVDYWFRFLPERVSFYSDWSGIDDQSLVAWLDRLGRPHTFQTPGLSVAQKHTVVWSPSWSFAPESLRQTGYSLLALMALVVLVVLVLAGPAEREGVFYLWVLYGLLAVPHTERYNHVLLLPAMAWLWRQERYNVVILAYFLAGLSRLNHLWAILLPAPWGPLASGFGVYAVLLLGGDIVAVIKPARRLRSTEVP